MSEDVPLEINRSKPILIGCCETLGCCVFAPQGFEPGFVRLDHTVKSSACAIEHIILSFVFCYTASRPGELKHPPQSEPPEGLCASINVRSWHSLVRIMVSRLQQTPILSWIELATCARELSSLFPNSEDISLLNHFHSPMRPASVATAFDPLPFVAGYVNFINPPLRAELNIYDDDPVWTLGSIDISQWASTSHDCTVDLLTTSPNSASQEHKSTVQMFNWTVQTYGTDIEASNSFFLRINSTRGGGIAVSHNFNVTSIGVSSRVSATFHQQPSAIFGSPSSDSYILFPTSTLPPLVLTFTASFSLSSRQVQSPRRH